MDTQQTVPGGVLSRQSLAEYLSVSLRTLDAMAAREELPAPLRLSPRRVVWSKAEVEAWLQAGAPGRSKWKRLWKGGRR